MKKVLLMLAAGLVVGQVATAGPIDLGIWDPLGASDPRAIGDCDVTGGDASAELECLNEDVIPFYNGGNDPDLDLATFGTPNIDTPSGPISVTLDVSGYDYLKLKWDGLWQFYYVGDVSDPWTFDSTVLNKKGNPQALSHYTFFSPRGGVPDGGVTLGLLGGALFALGLFGRRRK